MKTILIIKLLITLSIINHLKISQNVEYSKLDIKLIKYLIQDKLKMFFPTFSIDDLLYLVELILSEITEGNLNFKYDNKLPIQNSLDYANRISLEISIEQDKLTELISSDSSEESKLIILECLKKLNNNDMKYTDFPIYIYFDSLSSRQLIANQLNNKSGIYCWYCKPTGYMYVGSAVNLRSRTSDYFQESYIKNRGHLPIIRAMEKYGRDNFSLIILEYTKKENLIRSEQYWIDFITPSYNIITTAKNWSNHHHSEDAKIKIYPGRSAPVPPGPALPAPGANFRTGKSHSEETKKLMSLTRREKNNSFYGKTHSEETKNLMRAYQSSRTFDPKPGIFVNLYSSENEFLLGFKSVREAARYLNVNPRTIKRNLDSNKLFMDKYYLKRKINDYPKN